MGLSVVFSCEEGKEGICVHWVTWVMVAMVLWVLVVLFQCYFGE